MADWRHFPELALLNNEIRCALKYYRANAMALLILPSNLFCLCVTFRLSTKSD